MPTYEKLDYGSEDGSRWGSSTSLLGCYGAVPAAQSTLPTVGAASTYIPMQQSTNTITTFGFDSEAAFTSMVFKVSSMTVALRRLGLIA